MTIYVIALEENRVDYSGRDYTETVIDPDFGYFTDKAAAEAFVERIDASAKARYEERRAEYEQEAAEWQKKDQEARKLGFVAPHFWASRPLKPDFHVVVEIKDANS